MNRLRREYMQGVREDAPYTVILVRSRDHDLVFTTSIQLSYIFVTFWTNLGGMMMTDRRKGMILMKRLWILLLAALLLAACVPTPETEFIVNKNDGVAEQKLNELYTDTVGTADEPQNGALPRDPLAPQVFLDRWQKEPYRTDFTALETTGARMEGDRKIVDTREVHGTLQLTIDAAIEQKADGLYPVYRTRTTTLGKAQTTAILQNLFAAPTEVYVYEKTKEELNAEFQAYLDLVQEKREWDAAGRPDRDDWDEYVPTEEEVAERSQQYMTEIAAAPDRLETRTVSDYADVPYDVWSVYTLSDGHALSVHASETGVSAVVDRGIVYPSYEYEWDKKHKEGDYRHWKDVEMPREDADRLLEAALSRTGLSGFSVTWAYPANLMGEKNGKTKALATGWSYKLHRDYGGYPVPDVNWQLDRSLNYENDRAETYAAPIMTEMLDVMVGPNGVLSFTWYNPREIVDLVNENVELLPFDTIASRAETAITTLTNPLLLRRHSLEWYDTQGCIPVTVHRVILSTYTIRERNADTFFEMPCWLVFFGEDDTDRHNMDMGYDCLILNAVDGSIVHPDAGY